MNVFPNPYFGQNPEERNQLNRFVYFTNLGVGKTTIRIFTISGDQIRVISKSIDSEFSAEKTSTVKRSVAGINSIGSRSDGSVDNVITFTGFII